MRALISKTAGGPDTLELVDIDRPEPGRGQVRIAVKACAINYPDLLLIQDQYQLRPPRPFSPGCEVAGVIDQLGEGVTGFRVGDRVVALTIVGGLAEQVVVDTSRVFPLPAERSHTEGATILVTYGTAIHALADRGGLAEGETVLVLGAAGGVGLAALDIASALGARTVAGVSTADKAAATRAMGAAEVVVYGSAPEGRDAAKQLGDALKAAVGPRGADIIVDPVGGRYAEPALRVIAWEGRYLVVGFPAGIPSFPLNLVLLKACQVCGVFWGAYVERDPDGARAHVETLFRLWGEEKISPLISERFPLERGADAIRRLSDRDAVGKLVVEIG